MIKPSLSQSTLNILPLCDMSLDTFLSDYWQKKPLLIRQAIPNIASPLPADELAGLACEEGVESRLIIQKNEGKQWDLKHGPFSEEIFSDLPESHWTLLVQAVDHWVPDASRLLQKFNFIPSWRIDDLMISYASEGGGVGPHFDNYDVFLLQTQGKRRWETGAVFNEESLLQPGLPVAILTEFEALESWVLEPGDMLYLPPGVGHNGVAVGDDCMTCSIGFRAPSHSEILRDYTDYLGDKLSEALRYEDPDLIAQTNSGEISSKALEKIHRIMRQYIDDKELINDWFGRYITTPKYHQADLVDIQEDEHHHHLEDLKSHLASGGSLIRNETSRFAFELMNGNKVLFVDGQCFDCCNETSHDLNELIATLCQEIELSADSFPQSDVNLNLILELLRLGAIYLADS